jgi:hypothetical protein
MHSTNTQSGCFQRFETVKIVPPTTMSLEYESFEDNSYYSFEKKAFTSGKEMVSKQTNTQSGCFAHDDVSYESFEDNMEWLQMRSVPLWELQRRDIPYYAGGCGSESTRFHGKDSTASGKTEGISLVRKWEALMFGWLDRFGCGQVSSTVDNDLAAGVEERIE